MEWLDPQEKEEIQGEEVPKVLKDRQEIVEILASEETLAHVAKITTVEDLKETLVMQDHRENLVRMERREALGKMDDGAMMAEEAHQDNLDLPASQEQSVFQESLVLQDLEANLDRMVYQETKEKMETLVQGVLEEPQVLLEKKEDEDLLVERESQEIQDLRVLLDLLVPVESRVRMDAMATVF